MQLPSLILVSPPRHPQAQSKRHFYLVPLRAGRGSRSRRLAPPSLVRSLLRQRTTAVLLRVTRWDGPTVVGPSDILSCFGQSVWDGGNEMGFFRRPIRVHLVPFLRRSDAEMILDDLEISRDGDTQLVEDERTVFVHTFLLSCVK